MRTARTKTFMSGNSEAVRLPKGIGFGANVELEVVRDGDIVTLRPKTPTKLTMKDMLEAMKKLPKPAYVEVRDTEEIPERPGL
jgi:antitoxin VapB